MIPQPHRPFTLTVEAGQGTAHLRLAGDLDYDTCDELVEQAEQCLTTHPDLQDLRLDCAELRFCDSMGISVLLMIHRKTSARNIRLNLDDPPPFLERILDTTGVRHLFSQAHPPQQTGQATPGQSTSPRTPPLPAPRPPEPGSPEDPGPDPGKVLL
ncbi:MULTISPECIES: STAS domain-containing protein [unclassified Streptomyces]|uniref:STAS domain-containing protein n=1 Tax=unclassified Streptomyces TaxID=2593676 RepID=UPI0007C721F9|nr:STAS domain-containing protein [Streptomyces sp. NBRC 110035]